MIRSFTKAPKQTGFGNFFIQSTMVPFKSHAVTVESSTTAKKRELDTSDCNAADDAFELSEKPEAGKFLSVYFSIKSNNY